MDLSRIQQPTEKDLARIERYKVEYENLLNVLRNSSPIFPHCEAGLSKVKRPPHTSNKEHPHHPLSIIPRIRLGKFPSARYNITEI